MLHGRRRRTSRHIAASPRRGPPLRAPPLRMCGGAGGRRQAAQGQDRDGEAQRRNDDRGHRHQHADRRNTAAVADQRHHPARDRSAAAFTGEADLEQWHQVGQQKEDCRGRGESERDDQAGRLQTPQPRAAAPAQQPALASGYGAGAMDLATIAAGEKSFGHDFANGLRARQQTPGNRDCVPAPFVLYQQGRLADYGDTRLAE